MDVDSSKTVYLFTHGRGDLRDKAIQSLVSGGFSEGKITDASPNVVGSVGDYMAMLWMPPNPNTIKIQQITNVVDVEPEGMVGLWKGVSKNDLDVIPLNL